MKNIDTHAGAATAAHPYGARPRRLVIAGLIVAGAFAVATSGVQFATSAHAMAGQHHMGAHEAMDPAEMERHVGALVDQILPDGSTEQKARLAAIIRSAHAGIAPFHQQLLQAHDRAHALLMQPHVDRAALESLRADEVRQLDAVSRRLMQAVADAADLLTPAQREQLFQQLHAHMS